MSNYRPVYNLSYMSKTIERAVKTRLADYLSRNNLPNANQSSLLTAKTTPLKQLSSTFMTISSMLLVLSRRLFSVSS